MQAQTTDSINVGWKDRFLKVNGINGVLVLLVCVVLAISTQFILRLVDMPSSAIRTENAAQTAQIKKEHDQLSQQHDAIIRTQERIADTLEVQTFLMTKSDIERRSYRLDEPEALKRYTRSPIIEPTRR